jgi:hypothetical protein
VKYIHQQDVQFLIDTLEQDYKLITDWDGATYLGLLLLWDYMNSTVDLSMPGYIERTLHRFQHEAPTRPQHSPHSWIAPKYGAATQEAIEEDTSPPLS